MEALRFLLKLLYFTYKSTLFQNEILFILSFIVLVTAETPTMPDVTVQPPPIQITVDHIDDINLPDCYPQVFAFFCVAKGTDNHFTSECVRHN